MTATAASPRFEYAPTDFDCPYFFCFLSTPTLQGTRMRVRASLPDASAHPIARLAKGSVGTILGQKESCTCKINDTTGTVDPSTPCAAGATRACSLELQIDATTAGDDKLELRDASGKLRDTVTFSVRPAARLEAHLETASLLVGTEAVVGDLHVGDTFWAKTQAFDAAGNELTVGSGLRVSSTALAIAAPSDPQPVTTYGTEFTARAVGDVALNVSATNATASLAVHVAAR